LNYFNAKFFYPFQSVINRRCVNETHVKGILFQKGQVIQIDVESLHRDPELWGPVDTEKFFPDR
jgi:cytochrome P450